MWRSSYPAARLAAARLQEHFARHGAGRCALPDAATIQALLDAGFWASLQREEGHAPEISLAYLPPDPAVHPLLLASPLPLGPRSLTRLAPAVERPGVHLGVWGEAENLVVWGTTRRVPSFCFVLEVLQPGLLVVKHRTHDDSAKFRNVAVLEGERLLVLSRSDAELSEYPPAFRELLTPESPGSRAEHRDLLLRLAVSMRAHRRGGTLLVVRAGTDAWRESIVQPVSYAVEPPFAELGRLAGGGSERPEEQAALSRVVDEIAGLTAVDGATVINDRYELLAFGAKIGRPDGRRRLERVVLTEPIEGARPVETAAAELGGTRHSSAAQFAHDQHDAIALVASQDGRFTAFAWSPRRRLVHAHRLEALLL